MLSKIHKSGLVESFGSAKGDSELSVCAETESEVASSVFESVIFAVVDDSLHIYVLFVL